MKPLTINRSELIGRTTFNQRLCIFKDKNGLSLAITESKKSDKLKKDSISSSAIINLDQDDLVILVDYLKEHIHD